MIQLENVVKIFGSNPAVNGISMTIEDGSVCALIGPSGSGKTTLLRMINRLIEPSSGRVLLNGQDTAGINPEVLRRSIGYAIQNVGLFPHMTVSANIAVVPGLLGWDKKRVASRITELLELVGLDSRTYAGKYPGELSGGEAQRIGVARALAGDPPVLLMDEPFGAVDPLTRQKLQLEFAEIQKTLKKTVVLVTHDMDEAIRLADKVAIIQTGRLIQYDTPAVILSSPVNKFVHDFIGADRALKRLSLIKVEKYVKTACSIDINAGIQAGMDLICDQPSIWVVDEKGEFIGWADKGQLLQYSNIAEATVRLKEEDIVLSRDATLRDGLSLMLGQGVRSLPVVDENKRLIGELTLKDIEEATTGTEGQHAQ